MFEHNDDAGHCSNGLTARRFRDATVEERKTYRKWMRGIIAFYCALMLIAGTLALMTYSDVGLTQLTSLSNRSAAPSHRPD